MRKIVLDVIETTGSDGSATGSSSHTYPVTGRVVAVHVAYSGGQPATTDVTITTDDPADTVLAVSNNNTSGWYYPHTAANLASDGSVISGGTVAGVPVDGYISVSVAGADDGESVTVTLLVEND